MPLKPTTRVDRATNAAGLYGAGIICPAELWNQVADAIGDDRPRDILENCVVGIRHLFRRAYRDRPGTGGLKGLEKREAIRAWCESEPLTNHG